MSEQILCRKAKFWFNEGVLFCEFIPHEADDHFSVHFLDDFLEAISTLSKDGHFPLVIDLRALKNKCALLAIELLSENPELNSFILSKSFVVSSCIMKLNVILFIMNQDSVIPNKVFTNLENAIKYSLETNCVFNTQKSI
ncbi:hypothetical protein [Mariniflexile sp.]|uniref:DUF7793 family protein n=1 Tax=Mariniflexile sp. TaxID=1979402 RepID=UPI0035644092